MVDHYAADSAQLGPVPPGAIRSRLAAGTRQDKALLAELDRGAQVLKVNVAGAALVLAQTILRLADQGFEFRAGAGLEELQAFASENPGARMSTFFIAGRVVDGFVITSEDRTVLVCVMPTDREMTPAAVTD